MNWAGSLSVSFSPFTNFLILLIAELCYSIVYENRCNDDDDDDNGDNNVGGDDNDYNDDIYHLFNKSH